MHPTVCDNRWLTQEQSHINKSRIDQPLTVRVVAAIFGSRGKVFELITWEVKNWLMQKFTTVSSLIHVIYNLYQWLCHLPCPINNQTKQISGHCCYFCSPSFQPWIAWWVSSWTRGFSRRLCDFKMAAVLQCGREPRLNHSNQCQHCVSLAAHASAGPKSRFACSDSVNSTLEQWVWAVLDIHHWSHIKDPNGCYWDGDFTLLLLEWILGPDQYLGVDN